MNQIVMGTVHTGIITILIIAIGHCTSLSVFISGFTSITTISVSRGIRNCDPPYHRCTTDDGISHSFDTINNVDGNDGLIKSINGSFRSSQIREYWGKRPLLVRNAFPPQQHRKFWPSWDDIIQLSCDGNKKDMYNNLLESGESARFIQYVPGKLNTFTLEVGPFNRNELLRRMSTNASSIHKNRKSLKNAWSLLLNDVERYCPELDTWMNEHFHFLPRWRRDDAQVSCTSTVDGGIGPHVDNYDVCLIQISGQRLWRILLVSPLEGTMSHFLEQHLLIPNIPVSVLNLTSTSTPNTENNPINASAPMGLENSQWVEFLLNEGDMLYLPPRFVHWGLGKSTDCMTLSVGARAPSASDVLIRITEQAQQTRQPLSSLQRYTDDPNNTMFLKDDSVHSMSDPDLPSQQQPSLSNSAKESMKNLVRNMIDDVMNDDFMWDMIVGKLITDPLRYSDTFPIPWDESPNQDALWDTPSPCEILQTVQHLGPQASLRKVVGIASAISQIRVPPTSTLKHATIIDRLYILGEMHEVESIHSNSTSHNRTVASIIFQRIDDSLPINGTLLRDLNITNSNLSRVLQELIQMGALRPYREHKK